MTLAVIIPPTKPSVEVNRSSSTRGIVTVIQADDKLHVLARNSLGEKIFATPAIAENKIYLRTTGHLYALGE